jgi:hypothetical protein
VPVEQTPDDRGDDPVRRPYAADRGG